VNIAAHAHAIEFGLLAMLLGFFQGYVRLCESWKRNWAWLLLLGSLVLPVFVRSEEHTSELQSLRHIVCRLLLEKKKRSSHLCSGHRPHLPRPRPRTSIWCSGTRKRTQQAARLWEISKI